MKSRRRKRLSPLLLNLLVGDFGKCKVVIMRLEAMEGEWAHVSLERSCMMLGISYFENSRLPLELDLVS